MTLHPMPPATAPATQAQPGAPAGALLVDDRAAADLLAVSRSTWREMVRSGRAPAGVVLGTRARRWRRDELAAWVGAGCPPRHRWVWPLSAGSLP